MSYQADDPISLSVLLAEDNTVNQRVATALLGKIGHQVTICNNGREVVHAVSIGDYDVILMDIQMPVLDGLAATAEIRAMADPAKARIPIFAISANVGDTDIEHYRSLGFDEVLSKPLRPDQLHALLEQYSSPGRSLGSSLGSSPAAPAEPEQLLDEIQIKALKDALTPHKLSELFAMARESLLASNDALQGGWRQGDRAQIKAASHRMAGVARNFGCLALGLCAARIEEEVLRGGDGRSQEPSITRLLEASLDALP